MRFHSCAFLFLLTATSVQAADDSCPILERLAVQMDVVSSNIANAESTSIPEGGPYKRKSAYCDEAGCRITEAAEFRSLHLPGHPDADASGNVAFPRVDVVSEMAHMVGLQSAYDQAAKICRSESSD